jgi:hypothetical protein
MSPELSLAAVLALLLGPTAVWLALRVVRASDQQRSGTFAGQPAGWLAAPAGDSAPLQRFWLCRSCSSANHDGATRCYGCMLPRDEADPVRAAAPAASSEAPPASAVAGRAEPGHARPWVPVIDVAPMEDGVGPTAEPAVITVAATQGPGPAPADLELVAVVAERGLPVADEPAARIAAAAAAQPARPAARRRAPKGRGRSNAEPAVAAVVDAPVPARPVTPDPTEAAIEEPSVPPTPAVCPYLGLRDDRASHYSSPDPRNACHATGGRLHSLPGRRGGAGGRHPTVDPRVQATLCLSTSHVTCARYLAAKPAGR